MRSRESRLSQDYVRPFISLSGGPDQRFCERNFGPALVGGVPYLHEVGRGGRRFGRASGGARRLREPDDRRRTIGRADERGSKLLDRGRRLTACEQCLSVELSRRLD